MRTARRSSTGMKARRFFQHLSVAMLVAAILVGCAYLAGIRVRWTSQVYTVVVAPAGCATVAAEEACDALRAVPGVVQVEDVCAEGASHIVRCRGTSELAPADVRALLAPRFRAWVREAQIGLIEVRWGS